MNIEEITEYCLAKSGAEESFPFGEMDLVVKVGNKIFTIIDLHPPYTMNLKCNPERVEELRAENPDIQPGYHMNKKHWNTLNLEGSLSQKMIFEMIDHSYDLIVASLPKAIQIQLSVGSNQ
ncbi:MAG: MmcQ/YjbR family DNA-binding protein [Bacteroidetes bacterium]|nr:MmcQ/YjbR family DNA-binding protein [Bacteroidota bacterium]